MTTTPTTLGSGEPDEVRRGLAALQQYLDTQTTPTAPHRSTDAASGATTGATAVTGQPAGADAETTTAADPGAADPGAADPGAAVAGPAGGGVGGGSRRVRRMRAEVAEAHALLGLQADGAPLLVESPRVRRRRRAAVEAAQLHALGRDPATRAWRAAWWRRVLTAVALLALVLALGWSTAGVQHFAAAGAPRGSAGWWLAWLVEPLISLALLFIVGAKAFFAAQDQPLRDRVLTRIEYLFLGVTVTMNVWPYLPGVADRFVFSGLLIHTIGPVVAVAVVTALPRVWQGFVDLNHDRADAGIRGRAGVGAGGSVGVAYTSVERRELSAAGVALLGRVRAAVAAGELPARPTAYAIQKRFRGGMPTAQEVRDALAHEENRP